MSGLDVRLARAATWLGVAGVVAAVFTLTSGLWKAVEIRGSAIPVTIALGLLAVAGARLGNRVPVLVAGAGYLAAAALQLVQAGRDTNWLGGNGSTFSLFLGLGVGLLAVALAPTLDSDPDPDGETP